MNNNLASFTAPNAAQQSFRAGDHVKGEYCGMPFTGTVMLTYAAPAPGIDCVRVKLETVQVSENYDQSDIALYADQHDGLASVTLYVNQYGKGLAGSVQAV